MAFPPSPLATLYADPFGLTPISQPLIADGFGHVDAYVAAGTYTMVVALSNVIQNVYPDQSYGISSAQVLFETNGVPNPNQGVLNIVGAGDISVSLNALGQTVVESTGFVIPGTGSGTLVVTANAGVTTAPNGDILTADGLGNAQDSGVLITAVTNAVVKNPTGDQTISTNNLLPASANTTQSLGLSGERWNASLGTADAVSLNGVLNANDFAGADIGVKVNAAITQLGAAGGRIYIPAGTYNFANTIYIPRVVKLFGASSYGTVLNWTPTTSSWAIVVADGYGTSIYPEGSIEDLKLVGPTSTDTVGAIYIGGSDAAASTGAGFPASPLVGVDPSASYGDHFNFNRLNISQFGVGVQWGNNGWSNTFLECCITSNQTSIYFPNSTTDSGERLAFVGCSIQNSGTGLLMASGGSQVDVDFFFTACSFDFNAGNGTTTGWAVNNLNAVWEVNLVNCHVEQLTQWLQNYGYCSLVACNFTQGTGSGTLGYLINNQQADGFTVHGGTFFNGGSGTVLNTASQPSLWVGALINGVGGTLVSATGLIDPIGDFRLKGGTITGTITNYNTFPTAGNGVPSELSESLVPNQLGNFNSSTPVVVANTTVPSVIRVSYSEYLERVGGSSSTLPSLTLAWTDPFGTAHTQVLVALDTTNTIAGVQHSGCVVIATNGATVTLTSAGYASNPASGSTQMAWCLAYAAELL
jgi:hypothetical protein